MMIDTPLQALDKAAVRHLPSPLRARDWQRDGHRLLEVVEAFHPGAHGHYKAVGPAGALAALRRELAQASPALADFAQQLRGLMDDSARGVYVPELGLQDWDTRPRSLLVYAFTALVGDPTATDARQHRVIWDVKARATDAGYYSTFSETDREAAYHTDTQYYPAPERWLALYSIRQAACGGGLSSLCDAQRLREDLVRQARWVDEVLCAHPLPFRVPSAFATVDDPDTVQATLAPVFGTEPAVRYRHDTLVNGFTHFPELGTADVHRALDAFEQALAACEHAVEFMLPTDGLLMVDNHRAFHARTAFHDADRHMLRIRLKWEDQQAAQAWPLVTRKREGERLRDAA